MKRDFLMKAFVSLFTVVALCSCNKNDENNGKKDVDDFVAVTAITGVPATAEANKPLTLSATVTPSDATNQTIVWSVKDAGTTGAVIANGNILTATGVGSVTITATIAGGATKIALFTADFNIAIKTTEEMPVVTKVTVSPSTVSIDKGESQQFTATLTGSKLEEADKTVNWTVTGGTKAGTSVSVGGVLTVAGDETAETLTVTAISVLDDGKSGTASVTVTEKEMPSVTEVTVSPATVSIEKGESQQFTATLTGSKLEEADQTVVWTVTGGTNAGTAISDDGVLTVAGDETAENLTVTATSVLDNDKSGTASVTIPVTEEVTGPAGYITIDGYSGNTVTVNYSNGTSEIINRNADNVFAVYANNEIVKEIVPEGCPIIIAGRKADGSVISLKLSGGNLALRNAVDGYIPIGTYSEFQLIQTSLGGSYKQETDLDLLNIEWTPIGKSSNVYFSGTFDGDNHTLANLKISGNKDYAGLFGCNRAGTISNVHIISGSVSGRVDVGGICGYSYHRNSDRPTIFGCFNASSVSGNSDGKNVGGICGSSTHHITNCHNTGSVSGGDNVGGVCGYFSSSTWYPYLSITNCHNTGSVSGGDNVGGICGYAYSTGEDEESITGCYNTGSVSGSENVGGICGYSYPSGINSYPSAKMSISACYNTGSVSGSENVGGVIGYAYISNSSYTSMSITACYNTGSVSGSSNVGGVSGYAHKSASSTSSLYTPSYIYITACYNTGSVSGSDRVGGVSGYNWSAWSHVVVTACYWKDITGDNADYGIGRDGNLHYDDKDYRNGNKNNSNNNGSNTEAAIFAPGVWPIIGENTQWGIGDGSDDGKYWKSLGGWNGGNPTYPKLWFEK